MDSPLQPLRIVFMGTPAFSIPTFQKILDSEHQVVAVYTQPPRPSGRGHRVQKSAVHVLAESEGIPVFTPTSLRNSHEQEQFRALNADVAVVIAYGLILPKEILEAPKNGCVNVHGSLLPRWRGAAPMQRAILAGDSETGITIMCMDEGMDTGGMLRLAAVSITDTTTTDILHDQLAALGADLLLQTLNDYTAKKISQIPQPLEGVTYAPKLKKSEGAIQWGLSNMDIKRQVQALNPWPGVFFSYQNVNFKVLDVDLIATPFPLVPGTILDDELTIACGQGAIRILTLQKPGGAPMKASAFLRGYSFPPGTVLPCPATP